jgi:Ca-activated chloride channel family protein
MLQPSKNHRPGGASRSLRSIAGPLVKNLSATLLATALSFALVAASAHAQEGGRASDPASSTPVPAPQAPASSSPQPQAGPGQAAPPVQKSKNGQFTISAKVNLVVLPATVVDKKGRRVNDLAEDDFKVYENSAPQKLSVFSHADIPVTMGIVIDDSGSMKEKRPAVNAAALAFVETSNPQDQAFIVNFNDVYYLDTPGDFASNVEDLRSALSKIDSRGGTALYDAVYASLDHLRLGNRDKKTLLVITDGEDNASRYTFPELLKYAQQSNAQIYAIGLLGDETNETGLFKIHSGGDRHAKKVLEQLAQGTGGTAFFPATLSEVDATCRQIAHEIRNQYTLGYYPTNKATDGTYRSVRVEGFEHGTRKKLVVRTKPGYYAPRSDQPTATSLSGQ